MREEYKPKYDFEAWTEQMLKNYGETAREIYSWSEQVKEDIIGKAIKKREAVLIDTSLSPQKRRKKIEQVETESEQAMELLQHQFADKLALLVKSLTNERKRIEEEQRVDKNARAITLEIFNRFIRHMEEQFHFKSDEEISSELDAKEEKWQKRHE